jgi:hypothetical protein
MTDGKLQAGMRNFVRIYPLSINIPTNSSGYDDKLQEM